MRTGVASRSTRLICGTVLVDMSVGTLGLRCRSMQLQVCLVAKHEASSTQLMPAHILQRILHLKGLVPLGLRPWVCMLCALDALRVGCMTTHFHSGVLAKYEHHQLMPASISQRIVRLTRLLRLVCLVLRSWKWGPFHAPFLAAC